MTKGYMGGCGIRGGFVELINLDEQVRAMFQKSIRHLFKRTVRLISPNEGKPSYAQWFWWEDDGVGIAEETSQTAGEQIEHVRWIHV